MADSGSTPQRPRRPRLIAAAAALLVLGALGIAGAVLIALGREDAELDEPPPAGRAAVVLSAEGLEREPFRQLCERIDGAIQREAAVPGEPSPLLDARRSDSRNPFRKRR